MLRIDFKSRTPIYEQIVRGIKELIFTDLLKEEEKVPSIKYLSSILQLNPNHIIKAYKKLKDELIIEGNIKEEFYVKKDAKLISSKDKEAIILEHVNKLICEAERLKYSHKDIILILEKAFRDMEGETDA